MNEGEKLAVIDIGTNSVKLFLAEKKGNKITGVEKAQEITRLGEGFFEGKMIKEEALERSVDVVKKFVIRARKLKYANFLIVGTYVLRTARNKSDFINRVKKETGLRVKILSEKEENFYGFLGARVSLNKSMRNDYIGVVNIGGGSTELSLGKEKLETTYTFPLGALQLKDRFSKHFKSNGEIKNKILDYLRRSIKIKLKDRNKVDRLVGIGGTVNTLGRIIEIERERAKVRVISLDDVCEFREKFMELTPEECSARYRIPLWRADIMPSGTMILEFLMRELMMDKVYIASQGMRYGLALTWFMSKNQNKLKHKVFTMNKKQAALV